jgi:hypothetical protein
VIGQGFTTSVVNAATERVLEKIRASIDSVLGRSKTAAIKCGIVTADDFPFVP